MRSIVKVRSLATPVRGLAKISVTIVHSIARPVPCWVQLNLRIHFGARISLFDYRAGKLSNQMSPQMTLASLVGEIREKTH